MSVIATFNTGICPVLLGDLLVSGVEDEARRVDIPTIGNITTVFPCGSGFVPVGLTQKIAVLNTNLAVAWSGTKIYAKQIISELRKAAATRQNWPLSDLRVFFSDFDELCGDQVGIVGFSNDANNIFSFGYGTVVTKRQTSRYGLVRAAGSGAPELLSILEEAGPQQATRQTNPLETAVANALLVSTRMTGLEALYGTTLAQYYGGGFEILSLFRQRLEKVEDVTYLVWLGEQKDELTWSLSLPKLAIKYSYFGDALLIRRAELSQQGDNQSRCIGERIHLVSPIHRTVEPSEVRLKQLPSFNSTFVCSCVLLKWISGATSMLTRINFSKAESGPIRFINDTSDVMHLGIRSDFISSIFSQLQNERTPSREGDSH